MAEPHAVGAPPALDIRSVEGYDEIAVRAVRPRSAGWMIVQLLVLACLAASTIINARTIAPALLICFWALLLIAYVLYFVWALIGVKRIAVINRNLWVGYKVFRWTVSRAYRGADIQGFQASGSREEPVSQWRLKSGLVFTYETRPVFIHFDLDAPDVQRLADFLTARLPGEADESHSSLLSSS